MWCRRNPSPPGGGGGDGAADGADGADGADAADGGYRAESALQETGKHFSKEFEKQTSIV